MLKKITLAISRNPKRFLFSLFFGLTALWAVSEPFVTVFAQNINSNKYWFLIPFVILSIIIAIVRVYPKINVSIPLKNTNTIVNLKFGDLFDEDGVIAIPVNEYFDSKIGKPVSENSLHGHLIANILGGKRKIFDDAVEKSLSNIEFIENKREFGKSKKYPIGTTAHLDFGGKKYLLFALSKTNDRYEAYTTLSLLIDSLSGLLKTARTECNGEMLNIPLIGTGLSRSGIPPKRIIELILISILQATKQGDVTREINIVFRSSFFDELDIDEIKRNWA
jgi:hypothetical protein